MKKIILSLLAIIILALGGITYYGIANLDAIVKNVIEKVGSKVTGTTVTVAGVNITLKEGRGEISGLHLKNPEGFDSAHLFHLDNVALDIGNLFGDVIIIDEVLIDGADIIAEQKGQTTNLQALLENIEKSASVPAATETQTTETDTTSEPIRLMVKKFSFINNKASLETEQWDPQVLKVPNIVMNNLGDEEVGLTPEQLSAEVINRLTKSVEKAAKEALKEKAKEEAKKALTEQLDKNLSNKDKTKLDSLKKVFGQ
ncbi:MAG TPA: hypothetical protein DIS98_07230 [Colwellia sp.]|nr:hypothetical protein [Colwellia sp.]|tara:strand:+ start:264 stop:1034 length:771 start_codon:yes stop_codon:yes gene_type:complete